MSLPLLALKLTTMMQKWMNRNILRHNTNNIFIFTSSLLYLFFLWEESIYLVNLTSYFSTLFHELLWASYFCWRNESPGTKGAFPPTSVALPVKWAKRALILLVHEGQPFLVPG